MDHPTRRLDALRPPRRIVRAWVGVVVGSVLVAAVVAFAAHQWFYAVLLYSFLIGAAGGLFGWMAVEEHSNALQGTWFVAAVGLVVAGAIYVLYQYLRYRLAVSELTVRPGWWQYLRTTADSGAAFATRPGRSTIDLGAAWVWGSRMIELAIAAVCGAAIAKRVDLAADARSR